MLSQRPTNVRYQEVQFHFRSPRQRSALSPRRFKEPSYGPKQSVGLQDREEHLIHALIFVRRVIEFYAAQVETALRDGVEESFARRRLGNALQCFGNQTSD